MTIDLNSIAAPGVIGLALLAVVNTMPAELPAPFCRVPCLVWGWSWLHDAMKTFTSLRGPAAK